jgi:glucosamine 6-phosphate synthetase-like amidotransferase/phosphosugar isomerase protein
MEWSSLEKSLDSTDMRKFITYQGDAVKLSVEQSHDEIREIASKISGFSNIILTGAGDKYLIPLMAKFTWESFADIPCSVIHSRTLADNPPNFLGENSLVVFVSQSGKTKDTMDSLKVAIKRKATCVGISNMVGSPPDSFAILRDYDKGHLISTHTTEEIERPLPSTQTFHTSYVLLNLFLLEILKNQGKKVDDVITAFLIIHKDIDRMSKSGKIISWAKKTASDLMEKTLGFYVLADGIRYGAARKAALIMLMEGTKQDAAAMMIEEFNHSLIETLEDENEDKYGLIILKPCFCSKEIADQAAKLKKMWKESSDAPIVEIDPFAFIKNRWSGKTGNLISPIFYTVMIEWLTFYLALSRGIDPGVSNLVKKIRSGK